MSQAGSLSGGKSSGIRWGWIVLGLAILTLGAGLLVYQDEASVQYYMTVSEYFNHPGKYEGKKIKLAGIVAKDSLNQQGDVHQFSVEDKGKVLHVRYQGLAPDTFKEGAEVVVEGLGRTDDRFEALTLMAKCASKYEAGGLPPIEAMRSKSVY